LAFNQNFICAEGLMRTGDSFLFSPCALIMDSTVLYSRMVRAVVVVLCLEWKLKV